MTTADPTQTARAKFMARVRTALGRAGDGPWPISDAPDLRDELVRLAHAGPGVVDTFAAHASAAGMNVHRCKPDARSATILAILKTVGARRAVMDTAGTEFVAAREQLIAAGIAMVDLGSGAAPNAAFDADAGITGVAAAVAETGSILVASGPGRSRAAFIVPPVHIAIVNESQVVPDLVDLWVRFSKPPTALTLISGPSKTADIEGILVTGVHGPGQVHVVLVGGG
jgi:L-lactate dehydrogenase complex protein LldG